MAGSTGDIFNDIVFGVKQGVTDFAADQCKQACIAEAERQAMSYLPIAAIAAVTAYYIFFRRR